MYKNFTHKEGVRSRHVHKILLVMKLTTLILLFGMLQISAAAVAQKVNLSEKNTPLAKIFKKISQQTGYGFLVEGSTLKGTTPVTIQVKNMQLNEVLEAIFKNQPLVYDLSDKMVTVSRKEQTLINKVKDFFAVPLDVHGRVTDSTGTPLVGANVRIKANKTGVTTDSNGEFNLKNVEVGTVLEISYISYASQEVTINRENANSLSIVLKVAIGKLEEVNVLSTGYQVIPKERATGSFTTINNELYNQQVGPNVLSRLEGVANGLFIDRSTSGSNNRITIRGLSTIQGPKDPLVILDNFPYEGNIENINPNDIDNITILKDAAAASIWGARAGNGVIVITTKKGKLNQPLTLEFNSNVTIGSKPDLSYSKQMTSSDFIEVEKSLFANGYFLGQINDPNKPVLSPVVEILIKKQNGSVDPSIADTYINNLKQFDVRNDFDKFVYQKAVNQQYALMLRGGSDKFGWTASGGLDRNKSNLDAGFNRANLRFQNIFKPIKALQITSGIYFTQSKTSSGKLGYGSITSKNSSYFLPYMQLADATGNRLPVVKDYSTSYLETAGNGLLQDWKYYPLDDYKHTTSATNLADVLINAGINYEIFRGINLDVKYQFEQQQSENKSLSDQNSYFAREYTNRFAQISPSGAVNYIVPKGGSLILVIQH